MGFYDYAQQSIGVSISPENRPTTETTELADNIEPGPTQTISASAWVRPMAIRVPIEYLTSYITDLGKPAMTEMLL